MKTIYVLVNKYPNYIEPNVCVFIQQLVWSFADLDYDCKVICPMPINFNKKYIKFPYKRVETNENGKNIEIFHPKYISTGQSGSKLQKLRVKFTTWSYIKAVNKVLKSQNMDDAVLYSHFICPSGVAAARLGRKYGVNAYMAHGEAMYGGEKKYGNDVLKKDFKYLTGAIAVSSQNRDYLINAGVLEPDKIGVFPNGYRKERFYQHDKNEARKHFGWSEDKFIVGFCGSFDERKGILRLQDAVNQLDDVYFACAGRGSQKPHSEKCILSEPVNNKELAYFYSAVDAFVLPTENEGCCNAIVEAIACGCPIISSDRSFNYDILDGENAILIDPDSVSEIRDAISELRDNKSKRESMSQGSRERAGQLTLETRAKRILSFMGLN